MADITVISAAALQTALTALETAKAQTENATDEATAAALSVAEKIVESEAATASALLAAAAAKSALEAVSILNANAVAASNKTNLDALFAGAATGATGLDLQTLNVYQKASGAPNWGSVVGNLWAPKTVVTNEKYSAFPLTVTVDTPTTVDTVLVSQADANLTLMNTNWANFLGSVASYTRAEARTGGTIGVKAQAVINAKTNVTLFGYGTKLLQTNFGQSTLTFTASSRVVVRGFEMQGNGTEWDGTNKTGARGVYLSGNTGVTVAENKLSKFTYAAIVDLTTSDSRIVGNDIVGLGEYDATTNPRGITNGALDGDGNKGNYSFAIASLGSGTSGGVPYDNHIITQNFIKDVGTGMNWSVDYHRMLIFGNVFRNMVGQHGMYMSGTVESVFFGNVVSRYVFDGIKNQLVSGNTLDSSANVYIGNVIRDGRGGAWGVNIGRASGTKRHLGGTVSANIVANSLGGGVTVRYADAFNVSGNAVYNVGSYGMYMLDYSGVVNGNVVDGANWTGLYVGGKTGTVAQVRNNYIRNHAANLTSTTTDDQKSGITVQGGAVRLGGNYLGTTTGTPAYGIFVSAGATLSLDGTNFDLRGDLVRVDGAIDEINGDHVGQIVMGASNTPFNFADGTLRRGRGPGRLFNRNAAPTTGSFRVGDYVVNTAPALAGTTPNKYVIRGWLRLTTGSGNVAGTDWVEDRMMTGL